MARENKQIVPTWVLLSAACFAFIAIADIPYGFYRLLRWVICGVAIASAIQLHSFSQTGWVWALCAIAVIFNPLVPIHFEREIWRVFDVLAGCLFIAVFCFVRSNQGDSNKATQRDRQ